MRRTRRTVWRHAKEMFVARTNDEVGPGVRMDSKRLTKKDDMVSSILEC